MPGWTEPLEPFLADPNMTSPEYDEADIFEGLMAANRWDLTLGGGIGQGSQWAIPVMVETYVQSYRKDIYDELGIEPADDHRAAGARTTPRRPAAMSRASSSAASAAAA